MLNNPLFPFIGNSRVAPAARLARRQNLSLAACSRPFPALFKAKIEPAPTLRARLFPCFPLTFCQALFAKTGGFYFATFGNRHCLNLLRAGLLIISFHFPTRATPRKTRKISFAATQLYLILSPLFPKSLAPPAPKSLTPLKISCANSRAVI